MLLVNGKTYSKILNTVSSGYLLCNGLFSSLLMCASLISGMGNPYDPTPSGYGLAFYNLITNIKLSLFLILCKNY